MTIQIEVGKIYHTRDGQRVLIEYETKQGGTYQMQGIYLTPLTDRPDRSYQRGITWRSRRGRFGPHPHCLDLIL
jgi:hypothetical protein